jgi:hypothetical protein
VNKYRLGRKCLNAMLSHLAFHGKISMPYGENEQHEESVAWTLVDDGKAVMKRNSYGDRFLEHNGGIPYIIDEVESVGVHPVVLELAADNPANEELLKIIRKNLTS